jgi:hypothetical protein
MASSCTGAPVIQLANISAATVVCYVPYAQGIGNLIWINGTNFSYSSTLTLTLNSSFQTTGNLYDIFVTPSGGNAVLCIDDNAGRASPPTRRAPMPLRRM